jgi:hypothetical protein
MHLDDVCRVLRPFFRASPDALPAQAKRLFLGLEQHLEVPELVDFMVETSPASLQLRQKRTALIQTVEKLIAPPGGPLPGSNQPYQTKDVGHPSGASTVLKQFEALSLLGGLLEEARKGPLGPRDRVPWLPAVMSLSKQYGKEHVLGIAADLLLHGGEELPKRLSNFLKELKRYLAVLGREIGEGLK